MECVDIFNGNKVLMRKMCVHLKHIVLQTNLFKVEIVLLLEHIGLVVRMSVSGYRG